MLLMTSNTRSASAGGPRVPRSGWSENAGSKRELERRTGVVPGPKVVVAGF